MRLKRILSFILALCLASSMLVTPAWAAGSDPAQKDEGDITIPFEPVPSEPVASEPATSEPDLFETIPSEPMASEPAPSEPDNACGENVTWTLSEDGVLTISGTGPMYDYEWNGSPFYYNMDINKLVIQEGVTTVGTNVFVNCENLSQIVYSSTVSEIKNNAFYCCYGLQAMPIPVGLTTLASNAFSDCYSICSFDVAEGNQYFSNDSFGVLFNADKTKVVRAPYGIEEYVIPAGVTTIGANAFYRTQLAAVEIPYGVTTVEDSAFCDCSNLEEVIIPDSVTTIDSSVFMYCGQLKKISIGSGLEYLGRNVFSECMQLTDVTIAGENAYIEQDAFSNSAWFEAQPEGIVYVGNCLYTVKGTCPENVVIRPGTVHISDSAFLQCQTLVSVEIPEGVTEISQYAFQGCTALETVTIPQSVTNICDSAFSNCDALRNVYYAGCKSEWNAVSIGEWNYYLENANVVFGIQEEEPDLPTSGTCGENVTWTLDSEGTVTISGTGSMTEYGFLQSPFYLLSQQGVDLKRVVAEEGVTTISSHAFINCKGLTEVVLADSVQTVEDGAFYDCDALSSVSLGNGVTYIGNSTFGECEALNQISIPVSVYMIGNSAFYNCPLTDVYYGGNAYRWNQIYFGVDNEHLFGAQFHFSGPAVVGYGKCGDSVEWILDENGTLTISGYGPMADYGHGYTPDLPEYYGLDFQKIVIEEGVTSIGHWAFAQSGVEEVVIASTVDKISKWAFVSCASLLEVNIPESVHHIDPTAFDGCSALTGIWVAESNWNYTSDSYGVLFDKYYTELIKAPAALTAYSIPEYVYLGIGDRAFYDCKNLVDLEIPDSVYSIGGEALHETGWFNAQPDGVVYAGKIAYSFKGACPGEIVLREDTTGIAVWAFNGCQNLTSVTIPATVKKIGQSAFDNTGLTEVKYGATQLVWDRINIEPGNNKLTDANIQFAPPEVMESGTCGENLTWTLDTAGTLTISGTGAMNDYVYDEWDEGEYSPFPRRADSILKIVINTGVTAVGRHAFTGCDRAKTVSFADSVTSIGESAFQDCASLQQLQLPSQLKYLGDSAFSYCNGITDITIPSSVTYFGRYAFGSCNGLRSVCLSDGLTQISDEAFTYCKNLVSVEIPEGVEYLGDYAFYGCAELTAVHLPESLLTIGSDAFEGTNLTDVNIPENIQFVGYAAFWNTPWYNALPDGMIYFGKVAYVYKGTCPETVTLKNGTVSVAYDAFKAQEQLKTVVIPEGVTGIDAFAFAGCTALETVTLPSTLKTLSFRTFADCTNLKQIDLPEGFEGFNMSSFQNSGLTSVKIPSTVTEIAYNTFTNCTSLKEVTIPSSVKKIGDEAFYNCSALEDVYYDGTQAQWDEIWIKYGNDCLKNATIHFVAPKPLTITKQPVSVKVIKGATASVTVTATGDDLSYTWYVLNPGASKYVKSSITKSTYSFAMDAAKSGRKVYCVVTDKYGQTVTSSTVTMSMAAAPKITKQPVSVKVVKGKTASVTVTATGEGLTYTWYVQNSGSTSWAKSSITKSTYSFAMDAAKSGRKVYCVVTDKYGQTVKSSTVTMSMAVAPKITKQPVSVKVIKGKTATVTVTATGEGLTYTWYVQNPGSTSWAKSSITKSTYSFAMDAAKSGRKVYCVVTDKYGQTVQTKTVTLSMAAAPKITKQPVSVKVIKGKTATVTVTATGEGLTYTWYVQNPGTTKWVKSSITKNTYSFAMDAAKSGRKVYCVVTDKYGQTVKSSTVTMSMAAAPKITKQPVSVKVVNGKTAKVTFTASGEGLTYKWYYKDKGQTKFTVTTASKTNSYSSAMYAARNGRQVYCVVTDKYGQTVQTKTVTLSMAAAPKITKQPVSVKVAKGATAKVTFTASGEGLTYTWYYKDKGQTKFTVTTASKTNSYSSAMYAARNGRQLYCVVTDKYGQTVKTATVTMSMK